MHAAHPQLLDILSGEVAADWKDIGRWLLPANDVKNQIDGKAAGCQSLLYEALRSWLDSRRATMDQLVGAVKSPSVGRNVRVAEKLEGTVT